MRENLKYRPDIDGLRALAVLSVVLFHAFPSTVRGGFIGVDVFFVISGFLITKIICQKQDEECFSFLEFYGQRIRRIFPALLLMFAAVYAVGWQVLLADEFKQLGKHMVSSAFFVYNFTLLSESNYFENSSISKPFLHLWSLSIEEQFYLLWPLLLQAAHKMVSKKWITVGLVAASFAYCCFLTPNDRTLAFYSPLSRIWELLLGAILVWTNAASPKVRKKSGDRFRNIASAIGLLIICAAITLLNQLTVFPGFRALLPTVGAMLIIWSGPETWVSRRFLALRSMVWIGLISYPLYLWHWPILSLLNIISLGKPSAMSRTLAIVLSFILAALTYLLLEKPLRTGLRPPTKAIVLSGLMGVMAYIGYVTFDKHGIPSRAIADQASLLTNYQYWSGRTEIEFWDQKCFLFSAGPEEFERRACIQDKFANRPRVYLVGDSHAAYLSQGLMPYLNQHRINWAQLNAAHCVPLSQKNPVPRCKAIYDFVMDKIAEVKPDVVIIGANYQMWIPERNYVDGVDYAEFIAEKARAMHGLGVKKVIVLGQMPMWESDLPKVLLRNYILKSLRIPPRTWLGVTSESLSWNDKLRHQNYGAGVTYLALKDILCDEMGCLTQIEGTLGKDFVVFDSGHLTTAGAEFVVRKGLAPLLQDLDSAQ